MAGNSAPGGRDEPDNFIIHPRRRLVEQYAKPEAWSHCKRKTGVLARDVAGLPSELVDEDEGPAFRLAHAVQLSLLRQSASSNGAIRYAPCRIAEEKSSTRWCASRCR
jgi:hypothetical protein